MVDLVKIRKKAKKEKEKEDPAPAPAPPVSEAPISAAITDNRQLTTKLEQFKQTAGTRRETRKTEERATEGTQLELLHFVIAAEQYSLDIEHIVEIVRPRAVTRVPNAEASIVGIVSLRGTIVTLVDVRQRLRHPPAGEPTEDTRVIVVDFHGESVGFQVDRVLRVIKVDAAAVEPHPVVHASEHEDCIRGVFRHAGALTILLDFDKLLGGSD
jgi:purine-binding chemotaxis protein CheW